MWLAAWKLVPHIDCVPAHSPLSKLQAYWVSRCNHMPIMTSVPRTHEAGISWPLLQREFENLHCRSVVDLYNTEWRDFHCVLVTYSRRGIYSVGSRWYNHTHFRNYFTKCRTYKLYWLRYWNCPPSLSIHFWHLFIKFPIPRCSTPLLVLISSRYYISVLRECVGLSCIQHFSIYPVAWNLLNLERFVTMLFDL